MALPIRLQNTQNLKNQLNLVSKLYPICPEPLKSYPNAFPYVFCLNKNREMEKKLKNFFVDECTPGDEFPNRTVWKNLNMIQTFLEDTLADYVQNEEMEKLILDLKIEMQSRFWSNKKNYLTCV